VVLAQPRPAAAALVNYGGVLDREPSDPEVARVARRAFQNYGRMLTDFVLLATSASKR